MLFDVAIFGDSDIKLPAIGNIGIKFRHFRKQ